MLAISSSPYEDNAFFITHKCKGFSGFDKMLALWMTQYNHETRVFKDFFIVFEKFLLHFSGSGSKLVFAINFHQQMN
jgi:hypothetical protein